MILTIHDTCKYARYAVEGQKPVDTAIRGPPPRIILTFLELHPGLLRALSHRAFFLFFPFGKKKRNKPVQTEGTAAWKMGVRERTARAWRVPGFFSVRVVCCRVPQFLTRARSALDTYRLCSLLDESCRHAVHSGLGVGIHSMRPVPTGGHVR